MIVPKLSTIAATQHPSHSCRNQFTSVGPSPLIESRLRQHFFIIHISIDFSALHSVMIRSVHFLLFCLVVACSSHSHKQVVLLQYTDFGPQVIAHELLGMEWWQWQPQGHHHSTTHAIKVAVYHQIPLEEVKKQFPVRPQKEEDVRYVTYEEALNYLDTHIRENVLKEVTATLTTTRSRLKHELGSNN